MRILTSAFILLLVACGQGEPKTSPEAEPDLPVEPPERVVTPDGMFVKNGSADDARLFVDVATATCEAGVWSLRVEAMGPAESAKVWVASGDELPLGAVEGAKGALWSIFSGEVSASCEEPLTFGFVVEGAGSTHCVVQGTADDARYDDCERR